MENIIVGSKDCSISDIWPILSKSYILKEKWSDFAGYLRIPNEDILKLRLDLLHDKINRNDVLNKIIHVWIADQGSSAKLIELIRVVENECGDNSAGETLRLFYNLPCKGFQKESTNWPSLSTAFQEKVEQNISKLYPNIPIDTVKAKLEGDILLDMMTGQKQKLFKSVIPPSPTIYLQRIILPRHTISMKVFETCAPDIFLFTGLNEFELGKLVKDHGSWSTSGKQLDSSKIDVRFIALEQKNHFQEICERTSAPVHLLSYNSKCERLKWIQTCGQISYLQKFVDKCDNYLTEDELLESLKGNENGPVIIADSPGMGKSFLLANIATELQRMGEKIVILTSVNDFIKQTQANSAHDKSITDSVNHTLQNLICNNALGLVEFPVLLTASDIKIELLMDGFDEVSISDNTFAMEIIKTIAKSLKSIRIWVTTRPHLLERLEVEFSVLGYNIKGFDENDQINFLISHWQHSKTALSEKDLEPRKIEDYAHKVLPTIKSKLNKDDNDIAGIPLQCLLISESFEKECIGFASKSYNNISLPTIRINSISDLYEKMITNKFKKYIATHVTTEFYGLDNLICAHVDLSIKLLFPDYYPKLNYVQISTKELLKIGIIQASDSTGGIDFIHRTFAEYFVAGYVVEKLLEKGDTKSDEFINFLLDEILMRKKYYLKILTDMDGITSYKFLHDVIAYFLNTNIQPIDLSPIHAKAKSKTKSEIHHACANSSFLQLFKLFLSKDDCLDETTTLLALHNSTNQLAFKVAIVNGRNSQTLENLIKLGVDVFWIGEEGETYLHLASWYGNVNALKLFIEDYDFHVNIKDDRFKTPMDYIIISKENNRFEAANYLYQFGGRINDQAENHFNHSVKDGNAESIRIIRDILKYGSENLVEGELSRLSSQSFYLSEDQFKLLVKDFVRKNNTSYRDSGGRSLLHLACERGDELAVKELAENGAGLDDKDYIGNTPLHCVSFCTDLTVGLRITKVLIDNGANASAKNKNNLTFINILLARGVNKQYTNINLAQFHAVTEYLVGKNSVNLLFSTQSGPDGFTPLHFACQILELEEKTIMLLIKENVSFNQLDNFGQNALTYSIIGGRSKAFINLLINKCNVDWMVRDKNGNNALHVAARHGNLDAMTLLLDLGLDVNQMNEFGKTPLHIHAEVGKRNILEIAEILIEKGVEVSKKDVRGHTALKLFLLRRNGNQFDSDIGAEFVDKLKTEDMDTDVENNIHFGFASTFAALATYSYEQSKDLIIHKAVTESYNTYDCLNVIKSLIPTVADVCAKDVEGYTFFHKLLSLHNLFPSDFHVISKYLLDMGHKDLFEAPGAGLSRATVLHLAVLNLEPELETLQLFKSHGINFNNLDAMGNSLLVYAIYGQRSLAFLSLLVNKFGVRWRRLNNLKKNLLHISAEKCNLDALILFVNLGLDINSKDSRGNTPLYFAINHSTQSLPLIKCLIDHGAKVDSLNFHNTSCIHLAAEVGRVPVLKLFLDINVSNINAVDGDGDTPLHCAMCQKESDYVLEKVQVLLEYGADINILNKNGETALDIAEGRTDWNVELKDKLKDLLVLS